MSTDDKMSIDEHVSAYEYSRTKHRHRVGCVCPRCEQLRAILKQVAGAPVGAQCNLCGAVPRFDTVVPDAAWNEVVRDAGLPEFLCAACVLHVFALRGESFTCELWGRDFHGLSVSIQVASHPPPTPEAKPKVHRRTRPEFFVEPDPPPTPEAK